MPKAAIAAIPVGRSPMPGRTSGGGVFATVIMDIMLDAAQYTVRSNPRFCRNGPAVPHPVIATWMMRSLIARSAA